MTSGRESVDRQRWDELKALFSDAVERPRDDWPAIVDALRGRDTDLAEELQRLLDGHIETLIRLDTIRLERLAPGVALGPYVLTSFIGEGGMGRVYRARDDRLGRDVAIKVLQPDLAHDADRRARLEREARALAMVNHPNIVAVYDIGDHAGAPFIVSELLDGETLRERLASAANDQRSLGPGAAVEIVAAVADALGAAHRRGVVHRDVKPENIFLTSDGRTKVLDFGIAKHVGGDAVGEATSAGAMVGTLGYMAPEQLRGEATSAQTDVYACGVVLHELLAGTRPHTGGSQAALIGAILHEPPPTLPGLSQALAALVARCLDKRADARFADGAELAAGLRALPPMLDTGARTARGTRTLLVAAAIVMVLAGVAGTLLWRQPRDTMAPAQPPAAGPQETVAGTTPPAAQDSAGPPPAPAAPPSTAAPRPQRQDLATEAPRPAQVEATTSSPPVEPEPTPPPATPPVPVALSGIWTVGEQITEDVQAIACEASGALQLREDDGLLDGTLRLTRDCKDAKRGTADSTETASGLSAGTRAGDAVSFVTRVVDDGLVTTCRYAGRIVGSTRGTMAGEVTCEARSAGVSAVLALRGNWRATRTAP